MKTATTSRRPSLTIAIAVGVITGFIGIVPTAVQAGNVTAESIWSQDNALEKAEQQVPPNRTITSQQCRTIQVRNSDRYRCTVTFD